MADEDRRIAWLLGRDAWDRGDAALRERLSAAAAAGFRAVAIEASTATLDEGRDVESEARRLGLHVIRAEDVEHHRLPSVLAAAEWRALAQALSSSGFEGFILCGDDKWPTPDRALHATARALLRQMDRLDWASYH